MLKKANKKQIHVQKLKRRKKMMIFKWAYILFTVKVII